MNLIRIVLILLSSMGLASAQMELNLTEKTREELVKMYQVASEKLKRCSPFYAAAATSSVAKLEIRSIPGFFGPPHIGIDGDLLLQVRADSHRFKSVVNRFLSHKYDSLEAKRHPPTDLQTTPALDSAAAIERAKEYLKVFEMPLPPTSVQPDAKFNGTHKSCWTIRWRRFSGQYVWDWEYGSGTTPSETMWVNFHEKEGLEGLGSGFCCPEPKSLEVKLSKEEAIAKAEKCVPLVQRTPVYLARRMDGFVVKTVLSCELKVAAPNWLLDPKRATWIRNSVPNETRLCWIVQFTTRDTKEHKDAEGKIHTLMAPIITIYLDAATGEVVGAMFT